MAKRTRASEPETGDVLGVAPNGTPIRASHYHESLMLGSSHHPADMWVFRWDTMRDGTPVADANGRVSVYAQCIVFQGSGYSFYDVTVDPQLLAPFNARLGHVDEDVQPLAATLREIAQSLDERLVGNILGC